MFSGGLGPSCEDDALAAPEVLVQAFGLDGWVTVVELNDILHFASAPLVNCLVVVTNNTDVRACGSIFHRMLPGRNCSEG